MVCHIIYIFLSWDLMSSGPTSLFNFFSHFKCHVGYLCTVWEARLTGSASTLSSEYYFSSNGIWCRGVGVTGFALHIDWVVGADIMVTSCGSTLEGGWVLFFFCSTIFFWVSVVSSLVFSEIFPWNIFTTFLSESIISVTKGANGEAVAVFCSALINYFYV